MNLKNYLLEYVSSGRNRKRSGHPVEQDAVLEVGDIVRIKDRDWFDSLEKDRYGGGKASVDEDGVVMWFSRGMRKFLGEKVVIARIAEEDFHVGDFYPLYKVELVDRSDSDIGDYLFTNDMLEYA